jgi:hypothetical protein
MVLVVHGTSGEPTGDGNLVSDDWRKVLIDYITNLGCSTDHKVRRQALKYTVIDGMLYRRTVEGVLLKCLSDHEERVVMGEVHEGCATCISQHTK